MSGVKQPFEHPDYAEDLECPNGCIDGDIVVDANDDYHGDGHARAFCTTCKAKLTVDVELVPQFSGLKVATDKEWDRAWDKE